MNELVERAELSAASVAVAHGDAPIWARGYGMRHPEEGGAVDADTRFRTGSVNKVMTATALLGLAEQGGLSLDTPMGELLPPYGAPEAQDWTASLTSRQLLSHQGGFEDFVEINGPRGDDALADAVLGELFAQIPFLVEPGVMWNYSNPNFYVPGLVIEEISKMSYRDAVQLMVFDRVGMTRSTFDVDQVELEDNYARGLSGGQVIAATDMDNGWARPAGFAWTSASDLGRFVRFLLRGDLEVLDEQSHQELLTPDIDTRVLLDRVHYGKGLFHADVFRSGDEIYALENVSHGGNLPGATAFIFVAPERDAAIGVLGNGDNLDLSSCVAAALQELPGEPLEVIDLDFEADQTELTDYVGDYVEPSGLIGEFSVSSSDDGLVINIPVLDGLGVPYEPMLELLHRDNFLLTIDGFSLQLTGIPGDDGVIAYLRTRAFVGHKTEAPMAARSFTVDVAQIRRVLARARARPEYPMLLPDR